MPIISSDTAVHGIDNVIFKKLTHKGENKKGQLTATLELWEYIPQTIIVTINDVSKNAGTSSNKSKDKKEQSSQSNLSEEYKTYLSTKRGKSPAVDNASSSSALNKTAQLPY